MRSCDMRGRVYRFEAQLRGWATSLGARGGGRMQDLTLGENCMVFCLDEGLGYWSQSMECL